jgi:hypothetical protein
MALEVETGSGSSTAESFASVSDASVYFAKYDPAFATAWAALTTTAQEVALRQGARYLKTRFSFIGTRLRESQALPFPRADVVIDNWRLSSTAIPREIIDANIELAKRATSADILADVGVERGVKSESKSLDSMSKSVTYDGVKPTSEDYVVVRSLIKSFTTSGVEVRRA